ncbi:hypothetical protein [Arenimonas alkanexedens]
MSHKGPVERVDWFQVLLDLSRRGYALQAIAAQIAVPKSTLMGWKNQGHEPRHVEGERLLIFWARATEHDVAKAPRTHAPNWLG